MADDREPQNKWQIKVSNLIVNLLLSLYTIYPYDLCGVIWVITLESVPQNI